MTDVGIHGCELGFSRRRRTENIVRSALSYYRVSLWLGWDRIKTCSGRGGRDSVLPASRMNRFPGLRPNVFSSHVIDGEKTLHGQSLIITLEGS